MDWRAVHQLNILQEVVMVMRHEATFDLLKPYRFFLESEWLKNFESPNFETSLTRVVHAFGDREQKSVGQWAGTWTTFRRFSLKSTKSRCCRPFRKPTEVEWKYTEEGERVRVSVRTGRIIPKPVVERRDGVVPQQWKGGFYFGFPCSVIFKPSDLPRGPSFNDSVVLELCVYIRLLSLV